MHKLPSIMQKKHILLLFLTLFISSILSSQNKGILIVSFYDDDIVDDNQVKMLLYSDESNTLIQELRRKNDYWYSDSLEMGYYRVQVLNNNKPFHDIHKVLVEANKQNEVDINNSKTKSRLFNDTINDTKTEVNIFGLYGHNTILENHSKQNQMYNLGFQQTVFYTGAKYFSPGFTAGTHISLVTFSNVHDSLNNTNVKSQYYSIWNLELGWMNRISFYNNQNMAKDGLKLDLGLMYNLPVIFRQTQTLDYQTAVKTKWMTLYNNFYATAQLGYKYVGIKANCNLTTFLKKGFTEVPKYSFGLVFYIPAD